MDLCIWDKCNNRCVMCTNPYPSWPAWDGSFDYDYNSLIGRLEKEKDRFLAGDSIYLTGGEPTIHPNFLEIIKYLESNFKKQTIKLLTNGRRFCYGDFAKDFLNINPNTEIDVSLHGHDRASHDGIVGIRGGFKQAFEGIGNLLKNKKNSQIVGVRFVITKLSYKSISQFLEKIYKCYPDIDRVILIFWEAEAQAVENLEKIKIDFDKVHPYLDQAYDSVVRFKEFRLYHFPLCALHEKFWPHTWITLPDYEVFYPNFCNNCNYQKYCMGVQKTYKKFIGLKELGSVKKNIKIVKTGDPHHPIRSVLEL
ncbi:hypothetical protein A2331_01665 [Candidatus Falkowbacteria bacterium RIFOXYB2_FULL_34_18]|uniref:Radical SAM core domain-containing protein n=1 Tax=Candidatus Falkowbacteria bacterium RIFOXYD2_FULL_34_120 TaxID=1798007 RepID=A0A1F5TPP4_9BACT|nr:MAG: hypothetical protein A2331_01665 [Candidatus Falkowbacteria bacterium RIFOXYB2_FULL_34_18]OGF29319.1 MAG: hypothetical protein A2500_05545 [Candidatus Falkowbacteria bacterium RIFOXYC12_FULL_34_55]OGF36435.1 MAG: hypothetical protein A2466_01205 [Candidatus Falkowbacteria bacterium RIFOXYC2_FULL_34_220]OGF38914.1 MAG: hypothetical protein A2515_05965 [Candidatus Falkowbacteria bacterium RIFOXYD12_FULL_34_57]OGF40933.1 MAG: hypothetical protein A2531_04190 [Candidatus Falkowbacteria bact